MICNDMLMAWWAYTALKTHRSSMLWQYRDTVKQAWGGRQHDSGSSAVLNIKAMMF